MFRLLLLIRFFVMPIKNFIAARFLTNALIFISMHKHTRKLSKQHCYNEIEMIHILIDFNNRIVSWLMLSTTQRIQIELLDKIHHSF